MIQPISSINMYKNTFRGFYNPAEVSVPAAMKDHLNPPADTVDKMKNAVQKVFETKDSRNIISANGERITHILPSGDTFTTNISAAAETTKSGIQPIDGTNFTNGAGEQYHILPDGTPYSFGGETAAADAVNNTVGANIQSLDGSNFIDGSGNLNHILQSGTSYQIDGIPAPDDVLGNVDIPDPTGSEGSILGDIVDKISNILDFSS